MMAHRSRKANTVIHGGCAISSGLALRPHMHEHMHMKCEVRTRGLALSPGRSSRPSASKRVRSASPELSLCGPTARTPPAPAPAPASAPVLLTVDAFALSLRRDAVLGALLVPCKAAPTPGKYITAVDTREVFRQVCHSKVVQASPPVQHALHDSVAAARDPEACEVTAVQTRLRAAPPTKLPPLPPGCMPRSDCSVMASSRPSGLPLSSMWPMTAVAAALTNTSRTRAPKPCSVRPSHDAASTLVIKAAHAIPGG